MCVDYSTISGRGEEGSRPEMADLRPIAMLPPGYPAEGHMPPGFTQTGNPWKIWHGILKEKRLPKGRHS